nr:MAG TPA: hypothetical protein [Bacteriophage sp.]
MVYLSNLHNFKWFYLDVNILLCNFATLKELWHYYGKS